MPHNNTMAGWQSGYAAACKAVDAGSIPTPAFLLVITMVDARVAKLVDARDLKSLGWINRAGSSPAPGTTVLFYLGFQILP